MALPVLVELPQLREALPAEPVVQPLLEPQVVQAAQLERQAFQPPVAQSRAAQQERVAAERKPGLAAQAELREQQASRQEPQLWASVERPATARDAAAQAQPLLPSSA
jgi:hypothetical protein